MLSRVLRTIRRHRLLGDSGARRVLCAVSGGPDSMALLACLWELADRLDLTLGVAAVDHGLRPAAAAELALVAERSAALGVPFHLLRVDVAAARASARGSAGGRGVQEVARRLRLAALAELCAAQRFDVVALGHQADDQAETILFRILRGTGVAGLAGIPYRRAPFVRPLLDVTRAEIARYLRRRSIPFATDPSNEDARHTRARIRHHILPLLRRENPRLDEALRRLGEDAAAGTKRQGNARAAASLFSVSGIHVPGRVASDIAAAVHDGHGTRLFDVAGARIRVSYGQVHVDQGEAVGDLVSGAAPTSPAPPTLSLDISRPGAYPIGQSRLVAVHEGDAGDEGPNGIPWVWFDSSTLGWPLKVRASRPGDRMRPRGGRGSRKLSDLLIDAKVPRAARAALPVITDGDGTLLFVPGLRPSQRGAPGAGTRRRIGLAVVTIPDHHPSVDPSIASGNTQRYRDPKGLS